MSEWYWLVLVIWYRLPDAGTPAPSTARPDVLPLSSPSPSTRHQASRRCEHPLFLRPAAVMIWFTTNTRYGNNMHQIYHLISVFRWVKFLCVLNPVVWKPRSLSGGVGRSNVKQWNESLVYSEVSSKAHQHQCSAPSHCKQLSINSLMSWWESDMRT